MKRICIQWPCFGSYHQARLEAAYRFFQQQNVDVIGLETAGKDSTYAWRIEGGDTPFQRVQVFPENDFVSLRPALIYTRVIAMLNHLNPDAIAINSYSMPDAQACLVWCRHHKRIAVVMTDSKEDDAPRSSWREYLKRHLIRQFDANLAAGTPHRSYFEKLGFPKESIFLGYDVVDNVFFQTHADEARRASNVYRHLPGLETDTSFFLASNRFIPRKNLDGLLRAYKLYRSQTDSPWRLLLLGDGPERSNLESLIQREKIAGVVFCGFRQIEELPIYYGLAGAFVHPAHTDQWGLVVNEAMASGLPVLVSARAGCAYDLIQEGQNGFRFNPDNTDQLAHLMQQVASPTTDRNAMGHVSHTIIAEWSPDRFAEQLWHAVQAGRSHANRSFSALPRTLLWFLRKTARSIYSFHAVEP